MSLKQIMRSSVKVSTNKKTKISDKIFQSKCVLGSLTLRKAFANSRPFFSTCMPPLRILRLMQLNFRKAHINVGSENMLLYNAIFNMNGSMTSLIIPDSQIKTLKSKLPEETQITKVQQIDHIDKIFGEIDVDLDEIDLTLDWLHPSGNEDFPVANDKILPPKESKSSKPKWRTEELQKMCRTFGNSNCLEKQNLRDYESEKPYTCSICDKAFSKLNSMETHRLLHVRKSESVM